jgi:MFS family permease
MSIADLVEWRRGWRIAAGSAIGLGTGVSLYLLVSSLFIAPLTAEFGWSRGDMALAGTVAFVVGAVSLSVIGKLVDRFGFRAVVLVCVPATAAFYLMIAHQPGSFAFYLAIMVWGGIFGGGTQSIPYTRPIVGAFVRQRGLALGLATCVLSLITILVAPLLAQIIADHGWRAGFYAMGVLALAIGLPTALLLIGPEHRGAIFALPADTMSAVPDKMVPSMTIGAAIRTLPFWLLVIAAIAVNIPGAGLVGQLAPLVGDKGLSAVATGYVMSTYAVGVIAGRLVTGFALDRLRMAPVAGIMTLTAAVGMLLLLIPTPSFALLVLAVTLTGVQQGSEIDLIAYLVSRKFGTYHYGAIYGRVATFGALGTAIGLLLFGQMFDATGSYDLALMIGAAAFGLGAAAFYASSLQRT